MCRPSRYYIRPQCDYEQFAIQTPFHSATRARGPQLAHDRPGGVSASNYGQLSWPRDAVIADCRRIVLGVRHSAAQSCRPSGTVVAHQVHSRVRPYAPWFDSVQHDASVASWSGVTDGPSPAPIVQPSLRRHSANTPTLRQKSLLHRTDRRLTLLFVELWRSLSNILRRDDDVNAEAVVVHTSDDFIEYFVNKVESAGVSTADCPRRAFVDRAGGLLAGPCTAHHHVVADQIVYLKSDSNGVC